MKLHEAIEKMNQGDSCTHKDIELFFQIDYVKRIINAREPNEPFPFMEKDFTRDDWEIIPAEPKVLSAEELIDRSIMDTARKGGIQSVRLVELCRENFRLERDLELRPLIKAFKQWRKLLPADVNCSYIEVSEKIQKIKFELDNLAPLNKND